MRLDFHCGYTGTRWGMTQLQKHKLRVLMMGHEGGFFHHGDCKGGDCEAHYIATDLDYLPIVHPPSDDIHRAFCPVMSPFQMREPKKHLPRNRDIVNEVVLMYCAPTEYEEQIRGGTWYTFRYALKMNKPTFLILPNGIVKSYNVEPLQATVT